MPTPAPRPGCEREERQRVAERPDGMRCIPVRQHAVQRGPWPGFGQRPRVANLGAVARPRPVATDARRASQQEVCPDGREIQPCRDGERHRAVEARVEIDGVPRFSRRDVLQLPDPAPFEQSEDALGRRPQLCFYRHRFRGRARSGVTRIDPAGYLLRRADDLSAPRHSGERAERPVEVGLNEIVRCRRRQEERVQVVGRVQPSSGRQVDRVLFLLQRALHRLDDHGKAQIRSRAARADDSARRCTQSRLLNESRQTYLVCGAFNGRGRGRAERRCEIPVASGERCKRDLRPRQDDIDAQPGSGSGHGSHERIGSALRMRDDDRPGDGARASGQRLPDCRRKPWLVAAGPQSPNGSERCVVVVPDDEHTSFGHRGEDNQLVNAAQTVLSAIDTPVDRPVLAIGSLPPDGRDLDLLVRPPDDETIGAALARVGAVRRGREWALFAGGTAYGVEFFTAPDLALQPPDLQELFADSRTIDGFTRIVQPAPHHELLLLARIGMPAKRRPRLAAALADDPDAWEKAARRAAAWGVDLESLRRPRARRPSRHAAAPPRVVALSGLDGSGKSTQTRALAAALEALGYDVHVEWAPILQNASIERVSRLARVLLRILRPGRPVAEGESLVAGVEAAGTQARTVRMSWTTAVAAVNGIAHARAAFGHCGRGRVVVYDRFVLDSLVRLRFLYGREETFGLQRRLLAALSPRPDAAFWLDVPAERAYGRKPEHWDVGDLTTQRELYLDEHAILGVRRLDGELPPEDIAALIGAEAWKRL